MEEAPVEDPRDEFQEEDLDCSLVSPIILYRYLGKLFSMADANGTGVLERSHVVSLLHGSKMAFSDQQIVHCLSAYSQEQSINYREFIPVVIGVMQGPQTDPNSDFPALHALSDRLITRYLTQLFRFKSANKQIPKTELFSLLGLSKLRIPPSVLDLLSVISDTEGNGVVDTTSFTLLLLLVVRGTRASVAAAEQEESLQGDNQVLLLEEHSTTQATLREGTPAWEAVGEISHSAQLSLLHHSLLEEDGELLGAKGPPPATRREDDTDTLTAQVACMAERRVIRDCAKEIFGILDKNLDGRLSCDECCKVLGPRLGTRLFEETCSGKGSQLAQGLMSLEGVEPQGQAVSFCDWLGYFETQAKRAAQNGVKHEGGYLHKVAVYVSAMRDRLRGSSGVPS